MTTANTTSASLFRKDLATVALHSIWVLCFIVSGMSGMQIWRAQQHQELLSAAPLSAVSMEGQVFIWHLISGLTLSVSLLVYACFVRLMRQTGRLWPARHHSVSTNKRARNNLLPVALLVLMITSGWVLLLLQHGYFPWRALHRWFALGMLGIVLLHALRHLDWLGWRQSLYCWWAKMGGTRLCIGLLVIFSCLLALGIALFHATRPELTTQFVTRPPLIDGHTGDAAWRDAPPATMITYIGSGAHQISTPVQVKAVHDGQRIYLALRWPDDSPSRQHLPLRKYESGWKILHQGFEIDDERRFYEDKFAVLISNGSILDALRATHLGAKPLGNAPGPRHQRGYHWFSDKKQKVLDLWQWKAVRSDPLHQADDQHFGSPYALKHCAARYKAGYHDDPQWKSGARTNWLQFDGNTVTPSRLPRTGQFMTLQDDTPLLAMRIADSIPYTSAADHIPVGTQIPGIIKHDLIEGDRGHVAAKARWHEGHWYLEMSRSLNTHSPYDLPIQSGSLLWFAPFDHSQTRHAYHLWPLHLWLEAP